MHALTEEDDVACAQERAELQVLVHELEDMAGGEAVCNDCQLIRAVVVAPVVVLLVEHLVRSMVFGGGQYEE